MEDLSSFCTLMHTVMVIADSETESTELAVSMEIMGLAVCVIMIVCVGEG